MGIALPAFASRRPSSIAARVASSSSPLEAPFSGSNSFPLAIALMLAS